MPCNLKYDLSSSTSFSSKESQFPQFGLYVIARRPSPGPPPVADDAQDGLGQVRPVQLDHVAHALAVLGLRGVLRRRFGLDVSSGLNGLLPLP